MIDPFFGGPLASSSQWAGMPGMGLGWNPTLFSSSNRPLAAGLEGMSAPIQAPGIAGPAPLAVGVGMGPGMGFRPSLPMFVNPFAMSAAAGFVSPEIPIEIAGPALLAAVAQRRGQPQGPTNDRELEDFIFDVLDMLPGLNEIEVRCEGGRVTLTGAVPHKKLKRDVGEICWAIPTINDVQNNVTISPRRRGRESSGAQQAGRAE